MPSEAQLAALEIAKKSGGGKFLKLSNKESTVAVFVGDPYIRELFYNPATKKYDPYTEGHKARGVKPTAHMIMNLFLPDTGELKIFEMSAVTYKTAWANNIEYTQDGVDGWLRVAFKITRDGEGKDTSYKIFFNREINDQDRKKIRELKILTPAELGTESAKNKDGFPDQEDDAPAARATSVAVDNNVPIDETVAVGLINRLRKLEPENQQKFLAKFEIAKVRHLPKTKYVEADVWITKLEGGPEASAIDPFS